MMPKALPIKLSSPATQEFWEIGVLHEDADLLAIDKPARLLTSPDRYDPNRPNLMRLLHEAVAAAKPWAATRGLSYLSNAHRLDFETSGVLLLAKNKPALIHLANQFGSGLPRKAYAALVIGAPPEDEFEIDVRLAPDERHPGVMRWTRDGKKSLTRFRVLERFEGVTLLECLPETGRTHQIRVHLKCAGFPIFADPIYGHDVRLLLSQIKPGFRLKPGREENPLTPSLALHAWRLEVTHPVSGEAVKIEAPWPHWLLVAQKFLRLHAQPGAYRRGPRPDEGGMAEGQPFRPS